MTQPISFFSPQYIQNPQTLGDAIQNFTEGYFDLTNSSCMATILKVASYATLIIPAIALAIKIYLRHSSGSLILPFQASSKPAQIEQLPISPQISQLLERAPRFNGYVCGVQGTGLEGSALLSTSIRPANLLFKALFGDGATTMPGSRELFAFTRNPQTIRDAIANLPEIIEVRAEGNGNVGNNRRNIPLTQLYGNAVFRISKNEIQQILESQTIYTASILPRAFYLELKEAMRQDGIVVLPGYGRAPVKVSQLNTPHCSQLIQNARNNPALANLLNLTIYQLGSLVVKTEDYYLLTNPDGTLRERNADQNDAIRLINACGIRGVHQTPEGAIPHRTIMKEAFRTSLLSAENGYVIFPAVGMGVWGGDPNLYWRAFLDAVSEMPQQIEQIFVNPRHQRTPAGNYAGKDGSEFQEIFDEYRRNNQNNPQVLANLEKIVNLYDRQTDVLHFSLQLKQAYPAKTVSLFNASDPDVTLGNHVGEYVNNRGDARTTEENYTAIGTNGLCFENITEVHNDHARIIQT